jgi:hypothetical protein
MHRAFAAPSEEEEHMRALRILLAATLAFLALTAAHAQRVSPSISSPSTSSVGGLTARNPKPPSFYFNPKEYTVEKAKPWSKNKNKRRCLPPNC